jgi:hypothetical protein
MLEIESLGPLVTLGQGETTTLTETWELAAGVAEVKNETEIDQHIAPRIARK